MNNLNSDSLHSQIVSWTIDNNIIAIPMPSLGSFRMISGGQTTTYEYLNGGHAQSVGELYNEPCLFDGVEHNMPEESNTTKLLDKQITDIRSILALIYNKFQSRSSCLHCFFTIGSNEDKICFHYMNSIPIIRFSLFKDGSSTIVFAADWNGNPKVYDGWDIIPSNEQESSEIQYKALFYKAKSVFVIKDAKKINVYDWGFEIINDGGIQLTSILGYALNEKSENIVGKSSYANPFNQKVINNPDFMKIVASWNKY